MANMLRASWGIQQENNHDRMPLPSFGVSWRRSSAQCQSSLSMSSIAASTAAIAVVKPCKARFVGMYSVTDTNTVASTAVWSLESASVPTTITGPSMAPTFRRSMNASSSESCSTMATRCALNHSSSRRTSVIIFCASRDSDMCSFIFSCLL